MRNLCPDGLALMPFQAEGAQFALRRPACLIADEMGLGKTVQAIAVANATRPRKTLVICPAGLRENWKIEWLRWQTNDASVLVAGPSFNWRVVSEGLFDVVVIASYELAAAMKVKHSRWDLLIVDEAHYLKDPRTKRSKGILGSRGAKPIQASRTLFLTGTPIKNNPADILNIARYIDPVNHFDLKRVVFGGDLGELHRHLTSSWMIRRLKKDVLKELPPKTRQIIPVKINGGLEHEQLAINEALSTMPHKDAVARMAKWTLAASQHIMRARKITAVAKVPAVVDHIYDILDEQEKVVVFAHHKEVISQMQRLFNGMCVTIDGDTDTRERPGIVNKFQTDRFCRVFIGSLMAAGTGITLTASTTAVFAELAWTPADQSQAEDRLHRKGQLNPVLIQHAIVDGSIDSMISRLLLQKQRIVDEAIDGIDPDRPISTEEIIRCYARY